MRCPICKAAITPGMQGPMPFCSPRCKAIDLGKWLTEAYAVPVDDSDDEMRHQPPESKDE
ncbi:MAG: DNA gyrase inhibitor YacG [Myxococcales bacterium]|nr:DNA gyrase inhibitor YacG [Myxococcales bacterium]